MWMEISAKNSLTMASEANASFSKKSSKSNFQLLKILLKIVAVNIDGNDSRIYRIYSIFIFLFLNIVYPILAILELFKHDLTVVVEEMLMYVFSFCLATVKTAAIILKRQKFAKLLNKLEEEPFTSNPNRGGKLEEKLLSECAWFTKVQTLTYWSAALGCVTASNVATLIKRLRSDDYHDWVLPYGPFTVLNITHSPNYEITWAYQGICALYFGIQFTSVDLITAAVLAYISYQFRILKVNIRRLVPISYEKMLKDVGLANLLSETNLIDKIDGSVIPWKYLKSSLTEAVDYHLAIINIAQEMENLFNGLLLTIFLSTLGIICFLVYHTSLLSLDDPKLYGPLFEVMCACLQVATVCYWGEEVLFQSQEVGRAAYESNFIGTDLRFQKSLVLIMRRSQNPTKLTAGKFSVIALPMFAWIIRTSYSAFMMLRNTNG